MHNSNGVYELRYNGNGLCDLYVSGQATVQGANLTTQLINIDSAYNPISIPKARVGNTSAFKQIAYVSSGGFYIYNTENVGSITIQFSETYAVQKFN